MIGWLFVGGFVMISAEDGRVITKEEWDKGVTQFVEDYEIRSCINDPYSTAIDAEDFAFPEKFYMYHSGTYGKNGYWYTFYFEHSVPNEFFAPIVRNWPKHLFTREKFRGDLNGKRPNKKMVALSNLVNLDNIVSDIA